MSLEIIEASPLTTIQDLGRFGYERFGVPASGAMDPFALRAANELVGNKQSEAAIEIGVSDTTLVANDAGIVAVTGAGFDLFVNDRRMKLWTAIYVRKGWEIKIKRKATSADVAQSRRLWTPNGCWAYLGISGGLAVKKVLESRSTYLRGGFGGLDGRSLQTGDQIPVGESSFNVERAGRYLPEERRPPYHEHPTLDVILGPQDDHFTDEAIQTFLSTEYLITPTSDRMGYRLEGSRLTHKTSADIISDGLALGAIQVPSNGQPILMMSDHATSGGYPKIATVVSADIPLVAQRLSVGATPSGASPLRFATTTVESAQDRYRAMMKNLKQIVEPDQEEIYYG